MKKRDLAPESDIQVAKFSLCVVQMKGRTFPTADTLCCGKVPIWLT